MVDRFTYVLAMFNTHITVLQDLRKEDEIAIYLYSNDVIESLFTFTVKTASYSLTSLDPFRICFCSNKSEPDFGLEQSIQKEAHPGRIFFR